MKRKIEVDEDVYTALQRHAEPFVDTPNSVLRRLLAIETDNSISSQPKSGTRDTAPSASAETTIYRLESQGVSARAVRVGPKGMRLLKAESELKELPSLSHSNRTLRRTLIRDGSFAESADGSHRLTRPFEFSSPSAASSILLGRESNGRLEWKDERGDPLGER